ncbi:MAG: amino acid ABC transporter ATP-binding protein [Verrucomicrobiota bacterium]
MKLVLDAVSKAFGPQTVLDDIRLELEDVHALCLIGPSGGGKSTLLRIVAGLEYPSAGRLALNGMGITYREAELLAHRRRIGTVFQAYNLFPHLTALENITLPLIRVHGQSRQAAEAKAMELLRRFQLESHAAKHPAALSGGQSQRVAIIRALAIEPRVLLFDEPTSALDPEMTAEVLEVIEELKRERRDLLVVTHEIGFARQVADHVAFLANGRILEHGPPAQVIDAPQSEEARRFLAKVLKY